MSTNNFKTMPNFPLIVGDDIFTKICPECGLSHDAEATVCDGCGISLKDVGTTYDEIGNMDQCNEMQRVADEINEKQDFFTVSVESGYYRGVQFYVEEKYDMECLDNDDAHYYFGMCRSKAIRKAQVAENKVRKMLNKAKAELGLLELEKVAQFSDGSALYERVA